jgi:hypothetical protein
MQPAPLVPEEGPQLLEEGEQVELFVSGYLLEKLYPRYARPPPDLEHPHDPYFDSGPYPSFPPSVLRCPQYLDWVALQLDELPIYMQRRLIRTYQAYRALFLETHIRVCHILLCTPRPLPSPDSWALWDYLRHPEEDDATALSPPPPGVAGQLGTLRVYLWHSGDAKADWGRGHSKNWRKDNMSNPTNLGMRRDAFLGASDNLTELHDGGIGMGACIDPGAPCSVVSQAWLDANNLRGEVLDEVLHSAPPQEIPCTRWTLRPSSARIRGIVVAVGQGPLTSGVRSLARLGDLVVVPELPEGYGLVLGRDYLATTGSAVEPGDRGVIQIQDPLHYRNPPCGLLAHRSSVQPRPWWCPRVGQPWVLHQLEKCLHRLFWDPWFPGVYSTPAVFWVIPYLQLGSGSKSRWRTFLEKHEELLVDQHAELAERGDIYNLHHLPWRGW